MCMWMYMLYTHMRGLKGNTGCLISLGFILLRHGLSLNGKLTNLVILMASELQGCAHLHLQVHSHAYLLYGCWGSELGLSCLYSKHLSCRASSPLPNCVRVCKHYLKARSQTFWVILHCGVFELLLLIPWSGLEEEQSKVQVCLRWTMLVTLDVSAESLICLVLSGCALIFIAEMKSPYWTPTTIVHL